MLIPGRSDPHFGAKGRPGDDGISLISRAVPVEPVNLRSPIAPKIPAELMPKPPVLSPETVPSTTFSVENINASPGHAKDVEKLLNSFDENIKERLKKSGIKFQVGKTMLDYDPDIYNVDKFDYVMGMYDRKTKTIYMPQSILRRGKIVKGVGSKGRAQVLRHETGHAVDKKILPDESQKGEFVHHYALDYRSMSPKDKRTLETFVQKPIHIGREETFAEIYGNLTGGSQMSTALLKRAFPNVYKYMIELLKGL